MALGCATGGIGSAGAFGKKGSVLEPAVVMLELDRIMGAVVEDAGACVVLERFIGRL